MFAAINILKLHLHGVYLGEIAHNFHVLVEYPATHENCLEPIIGHIMSGKPPGEQIGEDCALNLPILTTQDRTDPIDERLDFIHFFVVRAPHVATLCRSPCAYIHYPIAVPRSVGRIGAPADLNAPANLLATQVHTHLPLRAYMGIAHVSSRLAKFSPEMPRASPSMMQWNCLT